MKRAATVLLVMVLGGALTIGLTRGPAEPSSGDRGLFSFAALGDAPYYPWENLKFKVLLQDIDQHDLACVVHVGDIFWRPCKDGLYERSRRWFDALRHPVIYTPGDNEWTDCWEPGTGMYDPLERLARLREILYPSPDRSLGANPIPIVRQSHDPEWTEFVENARWEQEGIVFATLHLVGSANAFDDFPGRTQEHDDASHRRTEAAGAWATETFRHAIDSQARAVVLAYHADLPHDLPMGNRYRNDFEPLMTALEEGAHEFGRPVLLAQGDDHDYIVDRPVVRQSTGEPLLNCTRLQVPGSPQIAWVRVTIHDETPIRFSFERRAIPGWKYW